MKRVDRITFKQLRALKLVADHGTIAGAADALGLTGPAVHNQLKTLEDMVGSPLLMREGAERNRPTPQGRALIAAHDEARAAMERAIHQIDAIDAGRRGSVVLGTVSTAKYFAPGMVARLHEAMPDIEVILKVGNREQIIAALQRRELDLCVMGRPPREPLVEARVLGDHPHILIAAPSHRLAAKGRIDPEELLAERFVLREPGSGTRILATRFLDDLGEGAVVRVTEMDSNETIKQAVISGLGLALISAHTVAEELRSWRLVALDCPGMPILRKWYLLRREDQALSPAAREVRDWILEHTDRIFPALE